ncbi:B12-binding domain-containing radical SAM protein [Orenia metallireducens]|uniref:B12-binding domain-containing radical SAM protein n=1 Tax=Orenia metallireducens TaxID=1413210 RepID=A0A1C0A5W8_9FIRM|nr:B12-binding domain-containing radical SAM protein [Orenia metallireducens]OCL25534.1 B12-binding domain-containing radical SAM protein [Orenia metallireducens]
MKTLLTTLNSKYIHSSLALRYIKSYCEDDFDIILEEYTINQHSDDVVAELYRQQADIIAFSCYIWNIEQILEVVSLLKKVQPEVKILLGGPEVSFDPVKTMEENYAVDYIICGEGEITFKEFLDKLSKDGDLATVKGLVYREDDKIIKNNPRPVIDDLDEIPSPYKSMEGLENKIIYFESNRGCPFNCQYCLSSTLSSVRYFSLERVKRELLKFIKAKVKQVKFVDRTFNCNQSRALEIFKFLLENKPDDHEMNFHFEITADLLSDEVIEFLAKVPKGYFQFEIGVQSTNLETLELIDRKMNFERLSEVVKRLFEPENIHLHLDLIAGLPKEDYQSFRNSFNDVYNLRPGRLQLGFLKLIKGSGLRVREREYEYVYTPMPPYEVLASKELSYSQMLKLKMIEEVLETFGNSHHFDYSIEFIEKNFYDTPFDMYESLAEFWEKKGYYRYSHKLESLYEYLQEFYREYCQAKEDLFDELLKFDLLLGRRKVDLPDFLNKYEIEDYKSKFKDFVNDEQMIKEHLPELIDLSSRQIQRQIQIETFKYNILNVIDGFTVDVEEDYTVILFNYYNESTLFNKALFKEIKI